MRQELLAPAGSLETFYAVIAAGANAVYLGGPKFGARAYAKNFTEEECIQAIYYAHLKGVKVYMTVNTLVKNNELEECIQSLKPYYEAGLDGVIVQDLGVLYALGQAYPGMELHASTQMSVSNKWGAMLLKRFGVSRVVPSRELSLSEIKRIREEAGVEVETFVHGALCYSYSGQCLMSSLIGGRSGNRGRCAQPCRLSYELYNHKHQSVSKNTTLLSLKDLAMLKNLPDLGEIPVDSLKIEGRMKQTEYAYAVVSLYRKYLDFCEGYDDINDLKYIYQVEPKDWNALLSSGNREGFTQGYYYVRNDGRMITKETSSHSSGAEENVLPKEAILPEKEWIDACLYISAYQQMKIIIYYMGHTFTYYGPIVEEAQNKPTTEEQILKQMNKTGNSFFAFRNIELNADENVFIPVSVLNEFRRNIMDNLLHDYLYHSLRTAENNFSVGNISSKVHNNQAGLSVSGNIDKHFKVILNSKEIRRVYLDLDSYHLKNEAAELLNILKEIKHSGKECYLAFPYVFRETFERELENIWQELELSADGFMARSLDSLGYLLCKKELSGNDFPIVADEMLYTYSDTAVQVFGVLGCESCTVPFELNKKELEHHENHNSEMIIYGKLPVMITANCVKKTCDICKGGKEGLRKEFFYLKDRKNAYFPVKVNCNNCGNVIYNSVPVYLMDSDLQSLQLSGYRIHFTDETEEEVTNILNLYKSVILKHDVTCNVPTQFTYGHFKRGVE